MYFEGVLRKRTVLRKCTLLYTRTISFNDGKAFFSSARRVWAGLTRSQEDWTLAGRLRWGPRCHVRRKKEATEIRRALLSRAQREGAVDAAQAEHTGGVSVRLERPLLL